MKSARHRNSCVHALLFAVAVSIGTVSASAAEPGGEVPGFFDAALCKPPYTMDAATQIYDAAEKLTKPDTSKLGAAIYTLPQQIGRDGFRSNQVIFASTSVGVLIEGQVADALAERYRLAPERSNLLGASTKGYSLTLPAAQQPTPDAGLVSIVARESNALPGQTLLACELVSKEDQQELDAYEKARASQP